MRDYAREYADWQHHLASLEDDPDWLERRSGEELEQVLQMQLEDHEDWVRGGRRPYPEWAPIKWARFWGATPSAI